MNHTPKLQKDKVTNGSQSNMLISHVEIVLYIKGKVRGEYRI